MIAFEILLNGQRLCTAGVGSHGVLSAIVGWTFRDAASLAAHPPDVREEAAREELRVEVAGLASDTHYHWPATALRPGDEVMVRICEAASADPSASTSTESEDERRNSQHNYVRHLCRELGWHLTES